MYKKTFTLMLCAAFGLMTSVCLAQSDDWQKTLLGKWKPDVDKTVKVMQEADVPEGQIDMMKTMLGSMAMEIKDGEMTMSVMGQENKLTYSVKETDEEKKWIKVEVNMEGQEEAKSGEFTIIDEDTIQLNADDGTQLVLARVKDKDDSDD